MNKCVKSIQEQTLKDIEIILVDDGSPDNCGQLCDDFAASDSRVRVIHKANGGLAAARNTGQEAACGEWITFVDGDDWLDADACEIVYNAAVRSDVDIVFWGYAKDYKNISQNYNYSKYFEDGKVYEGE